MTGRMARRAAALTAVIAAATTAIMIAPAFAAAASTPGTTAWQVTGERDLGPLALQTMKVTLVLTPRNAGALKTLVSSPHAALTPAQFNARFAPAASTVTAAGKWASANGLEVSSVSANRMLVSLTGSSTAVASAFHTALHRYSTAANGTFYKPTGAAQLPSTLASQVSAVLGLASLDKVSIAHPAHRSGADLNHVLATPGLPSSLNYPADYGPQGLWSLYDAPSSETGSGQQLSIITEGDVSQPKQDLATFEQHFGLPTVTWNQINIGAPSTDTSGDDEWDLDSQYSTGFAPGVSQLDVYVAPSLDDQDILTAITKWVTDDGSRQGSFSAGECDILADVAGFTTGLDAILKQADAQGQTMFFSSGDTGSQCPAVVAENGVPVGIPDTNYPASSPYGIGVGGTSVLGPGPFEIGWYAGGGGLSPIEPTAAFQANTKVLGVTAPPTRGLPDVSLDADPESGYDVVVDGSIETIGGTSAGAPSWQGIWARVEGAHSGGLSFAGPILYSTEPSSAYHDITIGANGLYTAGPGYDLVTGLGTPDIAKLVSGA